MTISESLAEARTVVCDALALKISTVLMIADEDFNSDQPLGSYGSDFAGGGGDTELDLAGDGGDGASDGHIGGQYAVDADRECCQ